MFSTKSTDKNVNYQPSSRYCSKCGSVIGSEDLFCQSCGSKLAVRQPSSFVSSSPRLDSFRGYIQILGVVEIVFGIFALLIGFLIAAVVPLIYYLIQSDVIEFETDSSMLPRIVPFISVILFGVALLILVYAFVSILSGKRLLQYKNSGRVGTMVIGALNLLNFPFGTIFLVSLPSISCLNLKSFSSIPISTPSQCLCELLCGGSFSYPFSSSVFWCHMVLVI
ncbi:MAG: zinc-ribbon domain-containing protein [Candidatus Hodarchaeales archaeon]